MAQDKPIIAIIVDSLHGGGAEKVCLLLARAMRKRGANVYLIVVKPLCEYSYYESDNVLFLLDDEGAKLYKQCIQRKAATRLRELASKLGGFDLLLSNLDGAHPIVNQSGLENVWYVVHNSIEEKMKRAWRLGPIKFFRQKKIFNIFNQQNLIAVSRGLAEELKNSQLIQAKSVRHIYNVVDAEALQDGTGFSAPLSGARYIIHVGRFAKLKRHDILLKAFKVYRELEDNPCKLVLLCEQSRKLSRLIAKYNLSDQVIITGFQSDPYTWMRNAELLVLSSDAEGFGMVLVEAMFCGTPVVSTDCRHGPNEILTGKYSEYLSPVGDPVSLGQNIVKALVNKPDMLGAEILSILKPECSAEAYLELLKK